MAITYSIDGGVDAAKFNINATSGALTFKVAPDFEKPGDANADNIYEVSVKATDAGGASSSKLVKVTVTDVSENAPPQITSAGAVTVKENATAVMTVTATDPDDGTTPPPSGSGDGSESAPFGPANYPTMLAGLTARPAWKVAGVDYRVGHPSNITLKNPNTSPIAGVSMNGKQASIDGNDVVIDGYDFGTGEVLMRGNNATIKNSVCGAINTNGSFANAKKMTVINTTINGAVGFPAGINFYGNDLTLRYVLFNGAESDAIQLSGGQLSSNVKFSCRYSHFRNVGYGGGHGDLVQTFNGGPNVLWELLYNSTGPQGNTQGFMYEPDNQTAGDGAKLTGVGEVGWNTFTGSMNFYCGATYADVAGFCQSFTVHDNFYDPNSLTNAFCRPGEVTPRDNSAQTVFRDNVDMRSGTKPSSAND